MAEEHYIDPKRTEKQVRKRATVAELRAQKISARQRATEQRKEREKRKEQALASQLLPDGTTPKLRASIMAAQRRHAEDPKTQELLERAKLAKRVQMAKRESGITDGAPPERFMGMDQKTWELEVANALPPPIGAIRAKYRAQK
jgi:hypothetical protein